MLDHKVLKEIQVRLGPLVRKGFKEIQVLKDRLERQDHKDLQEQMV